MSLKSNWSFLLDENTSRRLVSTLHTAGYPAVHVYDAGLQGHPDTDVFAYAQALGKLLLLVILILPTLLDIPHPILALSRYGFQILSPLLI